jgi:hypothetical protein
MRRSRRWGILLSLRDGLQLSLGGLRYVVLHEAWDLPCDCCMGEEVLKAETLHGTSFEQATDKGLHVGTDNDFPGKFDDILGSFYLAKEFNMISCSEWGPASYHFVQDRAHRPEIGLGVVSLVTKDLGSHVQRRAAERIGERC